MLATQATIETLADRIERAYGLRGPSWSRGCSTERVWETAAAFLLQLHQDDPTLPIDPELYVVAQFNITRYDDPWMILTQPESGERYRSQVRTLVRGLRSELRGEVREAERRVQCGEAIASVLLTPNKRLSPLGCYIVARRAGCDALAEHFRIPALRQHEACPLYRKASQTLIPAKSYPQPEVNVAEVPATATRQLRPQASLN